MGWRPRAVAFGPRRFALGPGFHRVNPVLHRRALVFANLIQLVHGQPRIQHRTPVGKTGGRLEQFTLPVVKLARHGGPWLLGDAYTALDAYAMMLWRWTRNFGQPARTRPYLGPYLQRVLARPAVQRVMATEQIAAPFV